MTIVQPPWIETSGARDWPMLVAGLPVGAADEQWIKVYSPSQPEILLARIPRGGAVDVDRAVTAARQAFPAWRALHFAERQRRLLAIADSVEEHKEELARLTAVDTGNALRTQARPECQVLADLFRYFGGVAGEVKGVVLPSGEGQLQYSVRQPLGIVGAILPWNSPLMIAGMKIPAALAAGNTLVIKAAEDAPLAVLRLAELCAPFLPDGVLNVITGLGDECGAHLVRHPGVDKVSFTGSTAVGLDVSRAAAARMVPASLELGGKNPNIVWPDAVSEATIEGIVTAMRFTRQGQSCTAGSRLFLHRSIYDEVLEGVVRKVKQLRIGDPLDEATDMGCLINAKQHQRVSSYIREGRSTPGTSLVYDGAETLPTGLGGFYHAPTIFSGNNTWRLAREEIFGPVMVVVPWEEDEEVLAMANDSNYGLAAYLWCKNIDRALGAASRIEAGWVQINQSGGQVVGQSYGGFKQSGLGREVSLEGMLEGFTQIKQVNIRISR